MLDSRLTRTGLVAKGSQGILYKRPSVVKATGVVVPADELGKLVKV